MSFRLANIDKPKTGKLLEKARKSTCSLPDCDSILTLFEGPGSDKYCRTHQKELHEYGGLAKGSKEHSFGKVNYCEECGWDPMSNPTIAAITDPIVLNRVIRSVLERDHLVASFPYNNSPDNLKTKCVTCHRIKTILSGDYAKGRNIV